MWSILETLRETRRVRPIPHIFIWLWRHRNYKTVILYGGAGAGKSWTLAHYIIVLAYRHPDKRFLITRKTNAALKLTNYTLIKELLQKYDLPFEEQKSIQTIYLPNRSQIIFRGLDDPEKIKSAEFNYIWMEEANEFTYLDFQILKMRLRRATRYRNQILLTFNPVSTQSWLYTEFFQKEDYDVAKLRLTYKDNKYLDEDYRRMLENLKEEDETLYKIYTLGEFATPSHLIYTNYSISSNMPEYFDEIIYGVDFGYNNPTVVLKIGLKDGNIYILEELYKTKLTNSDLIDFLEDFVHDRSAPLYCDSSEPARIEELQRAGFYAMPADKNVKDGIDFLKRRKIYISESCANTIKEIRNYSWKQDKDGNILDEPVKFMDHAMDAMRYAVYTHLKRGAETFKIAPSKIKGWW